jgi:lysophospholipase L1-like esterase
MVDHATALLMDRRHPADPSHEAPIDRFEDAIREYERQDKKNRRAPGGTVFTGSSTIALWDTLEQDMSEFRAINRGFGGSTIQEVTHYADRIITKHWPAKVVLYCGTNDGAEAQHSGWRIYLDFYRFVRKLRRRLPGVEIYYVSISTAPSRLAYDREFKLANKLIANWCAATNYMEFIDVVPLMRDSSGNLRTDWFGEDDLHMNPKGYAAWAPVIKVALASS